MTVEVITTAPKAVVVEAKQYQVVIEATDTRQQVVLEATAAPRVIAVEVPGKVGRRGDDGEQGPPGPPGPAGGTYQHTRDTPSRTWVLFHDLHYRPAGFLMIRPDGTQVDPLVHHVDDNTSVLTFEDPEVGTVYVS